MDRQIKLDFPLREGIDINEALSRRGATFSTFPFNAVTELDEDMAKLNDNISISNLNDLKSYFSTDNFSKIGSEMLSIHANDWVKKKIISPGDGHRLSQSDSVKGFYALFWEKEEHPFDFEIGTQPKIFMDGTMLPGVELAIHSMEIGEQAIFLISYKLMYGEVGLLPRIRPKETCLLYFYLLGPADANNSSKHHDKNAFQWAYKFALQHHKFGNDFALNQNYKYAAICFLKAVNLLDNITHLADEEVNVQVKLLKKLLGNLAVVYNKQKQPERACLASNRLNHLDALWNNPKALYQNACSLIMLGKNADAEDRLKKAASLNPGNVAIRDKLQLINRKKKQQPKLEMTLKQFLFNTSNTVELSNEFREWLTGLCL